MLWLNICMRQIFATVFELMSSLSAKLESALLREANGALDCSSYVSFLGIIEHLMI